MFNIGEVGRFFQSSSTSEDILQLHWTFRELVIAFPLRFAVGCLLYQ